MSIDVPPRPATPEVTDFSNFDMYGLTGDINEPTSEAPKTSLIQRVKTAIAGVVLAAEISPLNESIRIGAYTAGDIASNHNPVVGALTFGASTLLIEGAAALATGRLLSTNLADKLATGKVAVGTRKVINMLGYRADGRISPVSKAVAAFLGGSVVYMGVEKFDNPVISEEELKKKGLVTAGTLAGACAVLGAVAADTNALEAVISNPTVSAVTLGVPVSYALGKKVFRKLTGREVAGQSVWRDTDDHGNKYSLVSDSVKLDELAVLEQKIWDEKDYGNLKALGYGKYIYRSRTFGAFDKDGTPIAVNRQFIGDADILPPALTEREFYDDAERQRCIKLAREGLLEEVGTVAVEKNWRGKDLTSKLWRLAYRDAVERGVNHWAIIMEPERVAALNTKHGFDFMQAGPASDYQGGDCAVHVMDLTKASKKIMREHPLDWFWFKKAPLRP